MAKEVGLSHDTIHRIWKEHRLAPHRVETFRLSKDPKFVEKLRDILGLYLDPPQQALVISVDEKSQIQAPERTRPLLPLRTGIPARQTHDYHRHGTTTLYTALSMLDGKVIGECMPRHRSEEFIKFLRLSDRQTPEDLNLHLIVDNSPSVRLVLRRDVLRDEVARLDGASAATGRQRLSQWGTEVSRRTADPPLRRDLSLCRGCEIDLRARPSPWGVAPLPARGTTRRSTFG